MTGTVRRCLLLSLILVHLAPERSAAQSVGSSITVLIAATSGAGVRSMNFGSIAPGSSASRAIGAIADSVSTGVGHLRFTGVTGNRPVQLTIDLPSSLTHAPSGNSMAVNFNGNFGLHCFDRASGAHACTLFNPSPGGADPSVVVITPPAPPRNGTFRVYLGGSASASDDVTAGTYQGLVTVTLARL